MLTLRGCQRLEVQGCDRVCGRQLQVQKLVVDEVRQYELNFFSYYSKVFHIIVCGKMTYFVPDLLLKSWTKIM